MFLLKGAFGAIYTVFEEKRYPKKGFFMKACGVKNLVQWGLYRDLEELRKSNWNQNLKKKTKLSKKMV